MEIYHLAIGVLLLFFGRRLFWLFIGLVGFLFGLELSRMFFLEQPQWLQVAMAIGLGCLGALLAMVAQRLAFALGGFFAGVFLALQIGRYLALPPSGSWLLLIVVGAGVIGAVGAALIMDKAITLLACLVGAVALVEGLPLGPWPAFVVFVILAITGYLFQENAFRSKTEKEPPHS